MADEPIEQVQYGFQYPDGNVYWHEPYSPAKLTEDYSDPVKRAEEVKRHDHQVAGAGIKPSKATRLKFVRRTITTTFGEAAEVTDD